MSRRVPAAWWLAGLALALRAGWLWYRWHASGAALEFPDEELHWQLARNLVATGTLVTDDGRYAARMPLYPLFLSVFATMGTMGVLAAKLSQAVIGAVTALLAYRWAHAAAGPRAALAAGVLVALDPFAVFFANVLLSETLFTALLLALMLATWRVTAAPAAGAWLALALLGPAVVLTRPSAAALVPLVWLVVWRAAVRTPHASAGPAAERTPPVAWGPRSTASRVGLCLAAFAAALLPWGLRNQAVLGAPAWLSTNGGVTLYDALGPQAEGRSDQAFLQSMPELNGLDEVQRDRVLTRLALDEMRREPLRVLRLAAVKFLRTWNPWPNVAEYRAGVAASAGAVYTVVVALGAVVATARAGWSTRRLFTALWLPVLYFTLVHCIYIGSVRYRVPLLPLVAVAASTVIARRDRFAAPHATLYDES